MHAAATGQLDRGFVTVVTGVEDDYLVARLDQRLDRAEDRLSGPRRDGDLAVCTDYATVAARDLRRDLLAQGRQTGHRRVLVMPRGHMPADRVAQSLRTIEIREALGQIERAGFHGELRHAGEDGGADVRQLAVDHSGFQVPRAPCRSSPHTPAQVRCRISSGLRTRGIDAAG
ncbi:hypothetical protein FQZ97_947570 [compost metagenome]